MPTPLVSAVMPTGNRPNYVKHAIEMFMAQSWPEKELIILDDSPYPHQLPLIYDRRIRHIRLYDKTPLGLKHDMGVSLAMGEYICHWDDDDWFAPNRIERQVKALDDNKADVCGFLRDLVFFTDGRWGRVVGHTNDIVDWAGNAGMAYSKYHFHDGTAMFRRRVMREIVRYGGHHVSQKVFFLNELVNRGFKHVDIKNEGGFVYVRHLDNIWQPNWEKCYEKADRPAWFPEPEVKFYTTVKAS